MFSLARTILNTSKNLSPLHTNLAVNFHALAYPSSQITPKVSFLIPETPSLVPSCGFKVVGRPHKRCKDCYFVRREERMYVICNTHRRHKQMSMVKDPKNTWMLSHATQSKIRPW